MAPEIDGVDDAEDMLSARDALTMLGKGTSPEKVQGTSPEKGPEYQSRKRTGYQSRKRTGYQSRKGQGTSPEMDQHPDCLCDN